MESSEKDVTKVGFVSKDARLTTLEDGKKVANLSILTGNGEKKVKTYIRGWGAMAEHIANIKTGEKWEFKGGFENETKDGQSYPTLTVKKAIPHIKLSLENAEIRMISKPEFVRGEQKINIMIVKGEIKDGSQVSSVYNIELFGERNTVKANGFKKGDLISISGYARHSQYTKEGVTKTNIAFQNPKEIPNHSLEARLSKEASKGKSKGIGI